MSKILDSSTIGDKLYNSLPPLYREADETVNKALERYLSALAEGGMSKVVEETNGILSLIDPDKIDFKWLPILFKHYGYDVFNGLPELYLRKLLPELSTLFSRKGSMTSVQYLASLVSGVRSTISTDEEDKHRINIRLEMDYLDENESLPADSQLYRIVREFVPFYCTLNIVYSYLYKELGQISLKDSGSDDLIKALSEDLAKTYCSDMEQYYNINLSETEDSSLNLSDLYDSLKFITKVLYENAKLNPNGDNVIEDSLSIQTEDSSKICCIEPLCCGNIKLSEIDSTPLGSVDLYDKQNVTINVVNEKPKINKNGDTAHSTISMLGRDSSLFGFGKLGVAILNKNDKEYTELEY